MKITNIKQQKSNKDRFSVFIDNEFYFELSSIELSYFKLKINDNISEEKCKNIKENITFNNAKDKALKFLSYKIRSEKEIYNKLKEYEYTESIIKKVIDKLKEYNYINDVEFAISFIKYKYNLKGYGKQRIKYELIKKGIDSCIIDDLFQKLDINETEKALNFIEKKLKGNINLEIKEKQKLFAYLERKGYCYNIIKAAFKQYIDQNKNIDT